MKAGRIAVAVVVVMIMVFSTLPTYALPTKDTVRQPGKVSSNRAFYGMTFPYGRETSIGRR